jgi:molybdopterin-biosynthesis enzyme MoeA-like protein
MRGMLEDVGPRLQGGAVMGTLTVRGKGLREGDLAQKLAELEAASPGVGFGSYPWFSPTEGYGVHLVARSADPNALDRAGEALMALARDLGVEAERV